MLARANVRMVTISSLFFSFFSISFFQYVSPRRRGGRVPTTSSSPGVGLSPSPPPSLPFPALCNSIPFYAYLSLHPFLAILKSRASVHPPKEASVRPPSLLPSLPSLPPSCTKSITKARKPRTLLPPFPSPPPRSPSSSSSLATTTPSLPPPSRPPPRLPAPQHRCCCCCCCCC